MKAWLLDDLDGLEGLRLAETPDPTPATGEVVVDLEYAALNPADRYLAFGQYPGHPKLPHVLGRDGIGTISALGAGATRYQIGRRVLILRGETGVNRWGTLAERVAVSTDSLAIPPADWNVQQSGCAALVYLTAHQAITQWGELPPSVVLITGASGGVGVASIHLAKALGHTVVALSRDSAKREKLREFGADFAIDPTDPQWPGKLKVSLSPRKVDLAIDNIGGPGFNQILETLGPWGKISVVGSLAGPVPSFNTPSLLFRRLRIGGVGLSNMTHAEANANWEASVALMRNTGAKPVIDHVFPMTEVPAAFDRLTAGPMGKVLIDVRKPERMS